MIFKYYNENESDLIKIFDIEISIGLLWCPSVRDEFRYMWE